MDNLGDIYCCKTDLEANQDLTGGVCEGLVNFGIFFIVWLWNIESEGMAPEGEDVLSCADLHDREDFICQTTQKKTI